MKTIELEYTDPREPDRPPLVDWVPDHEVAQTRRLAEAAGFKVRELGPVSWQRQLARMENNPDSL